jgi:type IV pilus assembly protein PilM
VIFSRAKGVIGLDIGSSAVKLVELKERKSGEFHLQRVGIEPLSPEAIVDGSIMDSSLVVEAIQKLAEETGAKNPNFATSVSGHSVIIKKIQVPAMPPDELDESIHWEAEQYIPFDINDVRLDYVVLSQGGAGHENMEVLLVAVKRDKVNDYVSVISQCGKTAAMVDLDAFAVQNAFEINYDLDPSRVVALVNMGAGVTTKATSSARRCNGSTTCRSTRRSVSSGENRWKGARPPRRAGLSMPCRQRWRRRSRRHSTSLPPLPARIPSTS